ncbi:aldo/keto reductase [Enterococcus faecalis]|uniref:aldo/keto reductase n=1 Tax=Enterococcus faecalis TaxID=1351 RepID=UPI0009C5CCAF|nr:aldo/keto reductase [Enterococcus faecalis]MBW4132202.1 aldo/keto reductase [Enterococcus faecalis]MDG0922298.1 aldo/keto reductase [Enterococcus faecalis]MDT2169368.1 aldo/keto reductase [Enterococcus faecalis]OOL76428.1 hypothetical protein B1P85_16690 [Enterococcus faecalis]PJN99806.1 hypothetical protein CS914_016370 [Enterococcus faecalis]
MTESWYLLGHGNKELIQEELFTKLTEKYGKANPLLILHWHIQEGIIVFSNSTNFQHIQENIDIFDFSLADEKMEEIRELDKGVRFFTMSLEEQEKNLGVIHISRLNYQRGAV